MNETINNEIEMNNIETAVEFDINDAIPLDYEVMADDLNEGDNFGKVILGICAAAGIAIGGIALAKKAKKNGDKKEGFFEKIATKYLTKKGYTVEQSESTENDVTTDEDDYDGLIPDTK